jgi:hypothetical protein
MYFVLLNIVCKMANLLPKLGVLVHGLEVTGQVQVAHTNSKGFSTLMHTLYTNRSIGRELGWSCTGRAYCDSKICM